jgi:hypothetical protein
MKNKGYDNELHPGITMHKIPVKAGFAGLLFTIGVMLACLIGIPASIVFFVLAILLGVGVALMLRFIPRQAGLVVLVLTSVMIVCLAVIPGVNEWRQEPRIITEDLYRLIAPLPPPATEGYLSPYPCAGNQRKSKHPRDSKLQRIKATPSKRRAQSAFDGAWEGQVNDLTGVALSVADAGGGQIGGVITFYFQTRDDEHSPWHVAGKYVAPLLLAHVEGGTLMFEVQHHKTHDSPEFGPNVRFRMELTGDNEALLYDLSDPSNGPHTLTRQG